MNEVLMLALALALAAPDPLAAGRQALFDLDYEAALRELAPVADDERVDPSTRARAFVLIAEARFGMARPDADARAKDALRAAFALDPHVDFERRDDVSPRLIAMFEALRPLVASAPPVASSSRPPGGKLSEGQFARDRGLKVNKPLSAWWLASGGLAATSLLATGAALGIDAYLGDLPPQLLPDDVDAIQATGVVAVVVAVGAGAGALAASTAALLE